MDNPAFVVCWVVLLVFGVTVGYKLGVDAGEKALTSRDYWLRNLAALGIGIFVVALFGLIGLSLLQSVAYGAIAGSLTGLKLGFGESVGPWRKHDEFFNVNKRQRAATDSGKGAARRRRKHTGEDEPQLMSVEDTQDTSSDKR